MKNYIKTGFHSHFYANFCASVSGIFDRIFMKFSPECRTKKLGMTYTTFGSFSHFSIGKGLLFGPKSGQGKSLDICNEP